MFFDFSHRFLLTSWLGELEEIRVLIVVIFLCLQAFFLLLRLNPQIEMIERHEQHEQIQGKKNQKSNEEIRKKRTERKKKKKISETSLFVVHCELLDCGIHFTILP